MTFSIIFSINFPDRLNLVICNTYNAETSFLTFQASLFSMNINKQIMFLKAAHWTSFFSFVLDFPKLSILQTLSKSNGSKTATEIDQVAPKC